MEVVRPLRVRIVAGMHADYDIRPPRKFTLSEVTDRLAEETPAVKAHRPVQRG